MQDERLIEPEDHNHDGPLVFEYEFLESIRAMSEREFSEWYWGNTSSRKESNSGEEDRLNKLTEEVESLLEDGAHVKII